jgi:phosphate:Na+ symporter
MAATGVGLLFQVLMGLALFLFGMHQLETGVSTLGYAAFKRWLIRSTDSATGSVGFGIGATAILQSSSMVSLLVLAFASAGVLPLFNAVGVLLGANLGTTVTGWMVATVGFKLSLQQLALPLMAAGAALQVFQPRRERLRGVGILLFGFGLLIFGLDLMKTAVEGIAHTWNLAVLQGYGPWLYFIAGGVIAALIQSSSATMMMTLAALHGGLLDLQSAAALVIGADLGTTSTTALGSIGGHVVKRQLALAHVIFNLVVDTGAFFLLLPLLPSLLSTLGLTDPLYSLVAFHSSFNVIGLLLFIPLLGPYSTWIGRRFLRNQEAGTSLAGVPADVPDAALVATANVIREMRAHTVVLSLQTFELSVDDLGLPPSLTGEASTAAERDLSLPERYREIKRQESDLLAFTMDLQAQPLNEEQVKALSAQGTQARILVYSSKTLSDVQHNLVTMRDSTLPEVCGLYDLHREFVRSTYAEYLQLVASGDDGAEESAQQREDREEILARNEAHLQAANDRVREIAAGDLITGSELSNMLNANREVHHAIKNLLSRS